MRYLTFKLKNLTQLAAAALFATIAVGATAAPSGTAATATPAVVNWSERRAERAAGDADLRESLKAAQQQAPVPSRPRAARPNEEIISTGESNENLAVMLTGKPVPDAAPAGATTPTLKMLVSPAQCNRCTGVHLPGAAVRSPRAHYRIDSDLPEIIETTGVLYSTRAVLPPFSNGDVPVNEAFRTQRNNGFTAIDRSFEVFLYHLSQKHAPGETRRVVVVAKNIGPVAARLSAKQSMHHGPNAGIEGSVESRLTENVLLEKWDAAGATQNVVVAPGQTVVVGRAKQMGAEANSADASKSLFMTGILRCDVMAQPTDEQKQTSDVAQLVPALQIDVVAVDGSATSDDEILKQVTALENQGAKSGEGTMDLNREPRGCEVRRVVGTSPNALWRSEDVTIDLDKLPKGGLPFKMAMFAVQSTGCEHARQSVDMLLNPPYVHEDSVGNYMMEYHLRFTLKNSGAKAREVKLSVGKDDAPIGITLQTNMGPVPNAADLATLEPRPVETTWAGKKRLKTTGELFERPVARAEKLTVAPGQTQHLGLRLMVVGTSSLPYVLRLDAK